MGYPLEIPPTLRSLHDSDRTNRAARPDTTEPPRVGKQGRKRSNNGNGREFGARGTADAVGGRRDVPREPEDGHPLGPGRQDLGYSDPWWAPALPGVGDSSLLGAGRGRRGALGSTVQNVTTRASGPGRFILWPGTASIRRPHAFQACALPTELPGRERAASAARRRS